MKKYVPERGHFCVIRVSAGNSRIKDSFLLRRVIAADFNGKITHVCTDVEFKELPPVYATDELFAVRGMTYVRKVYTLGDLAHSEHLSDIADLPFYSERDIQSAIMIAAKDVAIGRRKLKL